MKFLSHLKRTSFGLLTSALVSSENIISLIFTINDLQSNNQIFMTAIISITLTVIFCVVVSYLYFDLRKKQKLLSTIIRLRTIPNEAPPYFIDKYQNLFKRENYVSFHQTSSEAEINQSEKNQRKKNQNIEFNNSLRKIINLEFEKSIIIEHYRSKKQEFSDIEKILNEIYELNTNNHPIS